MSLSSWKLFGNTIPFLLRDVIFVNENIITEGVQVASEHKRSIHKRAWVNQLAFLTNFHLLDVEYETAVEDLEGESALATEDQDLIVRDLVGKAHIARNPLRLIKRRLRALNLLPDVLRDVITLDRVDDVLLVDPATECKNEVVFEGAEGDARPSHSQTINLLPLVLLDVVDFAEAKNLTVDECADDVDEAFEGAQGMIGVRIDHRGLFDKL